MRIETVKYEIYKFNELSKDAQEIAINDYREGNDFPFLHEDMEEYAKILLEEAFKGKAIFNAVQYNFSYSQNDGAMIEFDLMYYNKYVKVRNYRNYCHEKSFTIDCYELTEKQEKQLTEKIYNLHKKLAQHGYDIIESENEDENIIDCLICNDYEYTENGKIY